MGILCGCDCGCGYTVAYIRQNLEIMCTSSVSTLYFKHENLYYVGGITCTNV